MADPMPPPDDFRYFRRELDELRRQLRDLQLASGTQTGQALKNIRDAFAAIPVPAAASVSRNGFGLGSGWQTYATATVRFPEGKTTAVVQAIGIVAAADLTSGGLAVLEARVVIAGAAGPAVPAAKDAGASVVNNVSTAMHTRTITGGSGDLTVMVQANPSNPGAFPIMAGNLAQIGMQVTFSR